MDNDLTVEIIKRLKKRVEDATTKVLDIKERDVGFFYCPYIPSSFSLEGHDNVSGGYELSKEASAFMQEQMYQFDWINLCTHTKVVDLRSEEETNYDNAMKVVD